jgi:hypoxia up-regulated 1
LWQPTSYLGAEKQYSFKNQKDFTINFYQHVPSFENVSPGSAEKDILALTTQNLTASVTQLKEKFGCTDGDINFRISTRLSPSNSQVEILKAIVDCEAEDTEKKDTMVDSVKGLFGFGKKDQVPLSEEEEELIDTTIITTSTSTSTSATSTSSSSASPSKDSKSKPMKHMEVVNVAFTAESKGVPQSPSAELRRMKDRISAFDDSDRSRRLREESLNQLEGFTYRARDMLDDAAFIAASTDVERASLEEKSKAASEWLYDDGADASREELKSRLKEMKDIVTPIERRKEDSATRP